MRQEIQQWAEKIGVRPNRIQIQKMTRKWASCSETGRICFSIDLLDAAPTFREAVIVHELLHLQVPNHGKLFKSLMSAYLPGWEDRVRGVTKVVSSDIQGRGPNPISMRQKLNRKEVNRMAKNEQTGKKAGSNASKVLRNPKSSTPAKSAAGSALTQRPDRKK